MEAICNSPRPPFLYPTPPHLPRLCRCLFCAPKAAFITLFSNCLPHPLGQLRTVWGQGLSLYTQWQVLRQGLFSVCLDLARRRNWFLPLVKISHWAEGPAKEWTDSLEPNCYCLLKCALLAAGSCLNWIQAWSPIGLCDLAHLNKGVIFYSSLFFLLASGTLNVFS